MTEKLSVVKLKAAVSFALCVISSLALAQNWAPVDTNLNKNRNVPRLYHDEVGDKLYLLGQFFEDIRFDSQVMYAFDGKTTQAFDTAHYVGAESSGAFSMTRYKGELYVGGNFSTIGKNRPVTYCLAKLVNDTFEVVNLNSQDQATRVYAFAEYKGDLIIGFDGDSLGGIQSRGIVAFDGKNFKPMGGGVLERDESAIVNSLAVFKNRLYAGGIFHDTISGSVDYRTTDFQVWNDQTQLWEMVDGWKGGHNSAVYKLLEYNQNLYILGYFKKNDNAIANDIVRYDGTFFYRLGQGCMSGGFADAVVHNGELWACGNFEDIDGIQTNAIARWDGTRWCSVSKDTFNRFSQNVGVMNLAIYHDTMFISGQFLEISGDTSIFAFARWIGDTTMLDSCTSPPSQDKVNYNLSVIQQGNQPNPMKIYPNPSYGQVTIKIDPSLLNQSLQLLDTRGNVLIWGKVTSEEFQMELDWLPSGTYILNIANETQRIVKTE